MRWACWWRGSTPSRPCSSPIIPRYYPQSPGRPGVSQDLRFLRLRSPTGCRPGAHGAPQIAEILQRPEHRDRTYDPQDVDRRADEVFDLFNEAWAPNWGHVPLTRRQFDEMFEMVKPCLRQGMAFVRRMTTGWPASAIVLPDLNPLVRKFNGRLTLWEKLRLLYEAKYQPITKVRALVLGVGQRYQRRRLHQALILRSYIDLVKPHALRVLDLSLIPDNLKH